VDHSADQINAFQQLGCGTLAYVKMLDCVDVLALAGIEIASHEIAFCLIDADGSPHLLRGSIAACLLEAQERGLHVVPVH
jgi:hypothetical protein